MNVEIDRKLMVRLDMTSLCQAHSMHTGVAPLMAGIRVQEAWNLALSMGLDVIAFQLPHKLSACEGPAVSAQPRSSFNRNAKAAAD